MSSLHHRSQFRLPGHQEPHPAGSAARLWPLLAVADVRSGCSLLCRGTGKGGSSRCQGGPPLGSLAALPSGQRGRSFQAISPPALTLSLTMWALQVQAMPIFEIQPTPRPPLYALWIPGRSHDGGADPGSTGLSTAFPRGWRHTASTSFSHRYSGATSLLHLGWAVPWGNAALPPPSRSGQRRKAGATGKPVLSGRSWSHHIQRRDRRIIPPKQRLVLQLAGSGWQALQGDAQGVVLHNHHPPNCGCRACLPTLIGLQQLSEGWALVFPSGGPGGDPSSRRPLLQGPATDWRNGWW